MRHSVDDSLETLISKIAGCLEMANRESAIREALEWLQEVTQCEQIVLCQFEHKESPIILRYANINYDPRWISLYLDADFQRVDPVLLVAKTSAGIFSWRDAYSVVPPPKRFVEAAADYGMRNGVALAYSRTTVTELDKLTTLCSFSAPRADLDAHQLYLLKNLIPALHLSASGLARHGTAVPLSARELEVLKWAEGGKTVWELSRILGVSEATVKFRLGNIYRKLNVANRAHAIARAIQLGILQ